MSLDVYLTDPDAAPATSQPAIVVRRAGATVEISRAEWDALNPGVEPVTFVRDHAEVYAANITHNLNTMAEAAGIYRELWRPEEIGITKANQLIDPLLQGLSRLLADRAGFEKYNAANGWGMYDDFTRFVANYLAACIAHPQANVTVSR